MEETFQEKLARHYYVSSDFNTNLELQDEFKLDLMVHCRIQDFREFNSTYDDACRNNLTHQNVAREFREKIIWKTLKWEDCVGSIPTDTYLWVVE